MKRSVLLSALLFLVIAYTAYAQDTIRKPKVTYVDLTGTSDDPRLSVTTNAFHRDNSKGLYVSLGSNSEMGGVLALGYTAGSWVSIFGLTTWDDEWSRNTKTKYGLGFIAAVPSVTSRWSAYAEFITGTDFNKELPFAEAAIEPGESPANTFSTIGFGLRYYFAPKGFFYLGATWTMSDVLTVGYDYPNGRHLKRDNRGQGGVSIGLALTGL